MSAESDLLRVVLALQMGFVTKEQVVECGAVWAQDKSKNLPDILSEKGYMDETPRKGLDMLVEAQMKRSGDPIPGSLIHRRRYPPIHPEPSSGFRGHSLISPQTKIVFYVWSSCERPQSVLG